MNVKEYAEHVNRSHQQISKWIKPGALLSPAHKRINGKNVIDVAKADQLLHDNLNQYQTRKKVETIKEHFLNVKKTTQQGGELKWTIQDSQIQDRYYAATLKKQKIDFNKGITVLKADVDKEAFDCARQLRDAIMSIRDRLSPILAAETDEFKIYQLLTKELNQALELTISKLSDV